MSENEKFKKRTMSLEDIETVINKMPSNTKKVVLTGGEIFLIKELLYKTIIKLKERFSSLYIELESNGKYIYDGNSIEILRQLKMLGVDSVRFSDDKFHEAGGIDLNKVRSLKKLEAVDTPTIKYLVQDKILGIGKAASLNEKEKEAKMCMNSESTINNPYFFIDVVGNVYICTWKCVPPIGNLIYDDFNKIIKELYEEFNSLILQGKILEAINLNDSSTNNKEFVEKYGECMLCNKFFNKNKS